MNAEQFVEVIKLVVRDLPMQGMIGQLKKPAGRKPPADLVAASQWYNSLGEEDLRQLHYIMKYVANNSLFNMLCVIDGVQVVEDTPDKGEFELYFVKNGKRILLNPPNGCMLHDIYNAV